jgi:hypothetical protein
VDLVEILYGGDDNEGDVELTGGFGLNFVLWQWH